MKSLCGGDTVCGGSNCVRLLRSIARSLRTRQNLNCTGLRNIPEWKVEDHWRTCAYGVGNLYQLND